MKGLESFCSRPKQKSSISRFDPDGAQNRGNLAIKVQLSENHTWDALLIQTLHLCWWSQERDRAFCTSNTLFSHCGQVCCQCILALRDFFNGILELWLEQSQREGESFTTGAPIFLPPQTEDKIHPWSSHTFWWSCTCCVHYVFILQSALCLGRTSRIQS